MKMPKLLFLGLAVLGFCTLNVINVDAAELNNETATDYAIEQASPDDIDLSSDNGTIYTDEYLNELEEAYSRVKEVADSNCVTRAGICWMSRTLSVNTYQQENGYYCGPANIKQVVQYINGSSASQSTYANRMGTNSSEGTYVYKMRDELNYRQSYNGYVYQQMNSGSYNTFMTIVKGNIFYGDDTEVKGKPIILHAKTASLYQYNGTNLGHYLTVNGYDDVTKKITYVDPWNANYGRGTTLGQHTDSDTNVFNTVSGSRYVIY